MASCLANAAARLPLSARTTSISAHTTRIRASTRTYARLFSGSSAAATPATSTPPPPPPPPPSSSSSSSSPPPSPPSPYYCTTPIFYVNASPHIGHLHSDVLADVFTRWSLVRHGGWSPQGARPSSSSSSSSSSSPSRTAPLLSTGTDEHGLKIQRAAHSAGHASPQSLCDAVSPRFRALADAADVQYGTFIRTTDAAHRTAVHDVWRRLAAAGHIYRGTHEGWYAVSDEAFYPATQVRAVRDAATGQEHHEAVETGKRVEWTCEDNYKFRLSAFREPILDWLDATPDAILPASTHAAVRAEVDAGLEDLSISRPSSRLSWGIPVPGDESQTIYVWIDALVNYLTVAGFPWRQDTTSTATTGVASPTASPSPPRAWPADAHVVGKDIIRFHAIYWPALLLGCSLPLPRRIVSHPHWTMHRAKMSKSSGNVADPFAALAAHGPDAVRFFLCRVGGGLSTDSDWSEDTLGEYSRKFLRGQLGNLASRVMAPKIVRKVWDIAVRGSLPERVRVVEHDGGTALELTRPAPPPDATPPHPHPHPHPHTTLSSLPATFASHLSTSHDVARALECTTDALAHLNAHVQRLAPWSSAASDDAVLQSVYYAREGLRLCALLLWGVMPRKMEELEGMLGLGRRSVEAVKYWGEDAGATAMLRAYDWESEARLQDVVRVPAVRGDGKVKVKPLFPPERGD